MKTIELFAGTGSFSKVAESKGHEIFCVDKFEGLGRLDLQMDLLDKMACSKLAKKLRLKVDLLWASPPCTTFSVASLGHHWQGGKQAYIPKTEKCKDGLK